MEEYEVIEPFDDEVFHFEGAYVIAKNDEKVLLLSHNGSCILISSLLTQNLKKHDCSFGLSLKLMQHGFASIDGIDRPCFQNECSPSYFIIDLTKKCNYDCIYCFRDTKSNEFSCNENFTQILEYIYQYCFASNKKRISIQAWGGEPLLQYERIFEISDFFKQKKIMAAIEIETNASLITDELAKRLRNYGIRLGISIDGPKEIQELQRISRNGKSSYEQTCKGISFVKKYYGTEYGSISVITHHNVICPEVLVDHLLSLGIYNMKFNIVRDNRYASCGGLLPKIDEIAEFYTRLFRHIHNYRKKGIIINESTIQTRYENLTKSSRNNCCESCGCTGGKSIVSFDCNGDIYPCEMTDFKEERIGHIFEGDLNNLIIAHKNSIFNMERADERCYNCPWVFFCRGGCTSRVLYSGSNGVDEVACIVNRTLYPLISEAIVSL